MTNTQRISTEVTNFLNQPKKLLINGEWMASQSNKNFGVENPANGDTLGQVAHGEAADIDKAVRAAREAFDHGPWTKMMVAERSKMIWKLADLMEQHAEQFAQLESLDNGKPLAVARAADVPLAVDIFRYMAGWSTKIHGETFPVSVPYTPDTRYLTYTLKEPVGVVGQIIPWNFPLLMAAWKLAPALASGCTVVLKPAEQTPLSALLLGELVLKAGFPKGVVNIVTGFGDAGAALVQHPMVDKVAFTGSTEVGRLILQGAASNLKKVSLELGGKSPNIVFADADLDAAIAGAASAIFFNHGQCCCAGSRLFVEHSVFDRVVDGVSKIAEAIQIGDGFDPGTQMGPLVSREQFDKVCGYIQSGVKDGAQLKAGGKALERPGYFVRPTVMTDTASHMKVIQEEIFGPVVAAMPFKNTDDVVKEANNTDYGLAAGIWTRDLSKAHAMSAKLRVGTTWVNCYNIFDAALPFGGYKQSGWGREMGKQAIDLYTETKSVCLPLS